MNDVAATGGALVGWVNASWPFAKLAVSAKLLKLSVSTVGSYDFDPADVISLDEYGSIPFFARGIKIVHRRADYPAKIVFWCLGSREKLMNQIREAGFVPSAPAGTVFRPDGIPVRWLAILLIILIWNGLFFLNRLTGGEDPGRPPGPFVILALALLFGLSWAVPASRNLQKLILKPGRNYGEIKPFIALIRLVSGFLLVGFSVMLLAFYIST